MGSGQQIGSGQPLPDSVPAALVRGSSIGRYIVLAMVGRGGMGEVYAAYDPEMDRKVAVKLLRVKPGNGVSLSEGRTRTLREAQAIARLSHPNVVIAYDVGTFEDKVFIAMEYVEGNTVTYWLQVQQRSWREILKVFIDAGRGLAAAHEKGLVHRDFKTDNVMVSRDRHVRVMDFGLARQMPTRAAPAPAPAEPTAAAPVVAQPIPIRILTSGSSVDGDGPQTVVVTGDHAAPHPDRRAFELGHVRRAADAHGRDDGDARVHGARAVPRHADRRAQRSVQLLHRAVRSAVRRAPVRGHVDDDAHRERRAGQRPRRAREFEGAAVGAQGLAARAAAARPQDRWPSMEAMLEALGKNPNIQRRKWAAAAAGAAVIGGLALGGWRTGQ